ncbi:MAG: hypothetical protein IJ019_03350 [Alphaproteobacteria bacterium]|nr:hypothetical protein [Alphaproteobacteria bacterium]
MSNILANAQAMRFLNELGLDGYKLNHDYVVIPTGVKFVFSHGGKEYFPNEAHYYRPNTEKGADYTSGVGVISPANGKFDIYTCNLEMVEQAQKAMHGASNSIPVRFYKGGRDVCFDDQTINDTFDAMFERQHQERLNKEDKQAYDDATKNTEKAKALLEKLGLEGFEEGTNYVIIANGEPYHAWDSWENKTGQQGYINLERLGYEKDGRICSSYNGGAMTIYDGKSDFIILTTDTKMMDMVKTSKTGGWVPCYNAGREVIFDNKYVEYNFSGMIGHTDNMIKQAEKKQFMQQKNNAYEP